MSNITLEQAQQLAAAQGMQIVQHEDGQFSLAPLNGNPTPTPATPTPVPTPQQTSSMRLMDYGSAGAGMGTKTLVEAFRACGRAVNNGQDIHHGE